MWPASILEESAGLWISLWAVPLIVLYLCSWCLHLSLSPKFKLTFATTSGHVAGLDGFLTRALSLESAWWDSRNRCVGCNNLLIYSVFLHFRLPWGILCVDTPWGAWLSSWVAPCLLQYFVWKLPGKCHWSSVQGLMMSPFVLVPSSEGWEGALQHPRVVSYSCHLGSLTILCCIAGCDDVHSCCGTQQLWFNRCLANRGHWLSLGCI